jgi:hypothetical protein
MKYADLDINIYIKHVCLVSRVEIDALFVSLSVTDNVFREVQGHAVES